MKPLDRVILSAINKNLINPTELHIRQITGSVTKITNDVITLQTDDGTMKIPFIPNFIINQSISIGVYDVPDRADFLKLEIIVPGAAAVDNQIYQFLLKRDNFNQKSLQNEDLVEITQANINQKLYQLVAIDDLGNKLNINLELNNDGVDKAFLRGNDIYLTINDRLYRVIVEVPNLKNILNSGPQNISLLISEEFNLKGSFIHLIDRLPKSLPIQTLVEVASIISKSTPITIPINYLEAYKSLFMPIFSQFRKARLQIRESRSSCNTLRFIFEFESEDARILIIDCLYLSASLHVIIRSDYELSPETKTRFTLCLNRIALEMSLDSSISFIVQSENYLSQISTNIDHDSNDHSYTYNI